MTEGIAAVPSRCSLTLLLLLEFLSPPKGPLHIVSAISIIKPEARIEKKNTNNKTKANSTSILYQSQNASASRRLPPISHRCPDN